MAKITIDIDMEKKTVALRDIPEELAREPVTLALVFTQCATRMLSGIKIEPVSKIIKPKMKIAGG